jgi:hypothetical protein
MGFLSGIRWEKPYYLIRSSLATSLQDKVGLKLVQTQFESGRILVRVYGPFDAGVKKGQLLLDPGAHLIQRRLLID